MLTCLLRWFPPLSSVGLCPSMVSCSVAVAPWGRNPVQHIWIHNWTHCFDNVNNNNKKLWKNKMTFNQHFKFLFLQRRKAEEGQLLSTVLPFICTCAAGESAATQYVVLETLWMSMRLPEAF